MNREIYVHIDRLVLDGATLDGLDPGVISEQVRAELEVVLAQRGVKGDLASGGARGTARGGDITGPGPLGAQIARAIHAGLSGETGEQP